MNKPLTAKINEKGHFEVGGCDTTDLVKQFGTPLYVLDELTIRHNCRQYVSTLKSKYPNSLVIYASKALCNTAVLKMVGDEGMGLDVSSGGELFTARKANFDLSKIYFHGNNKSTREIEEGISANVKFVVDNLVELENLEKQSQKFKKRVDILFRVNPGIEAHTHEFIQTGKIDSKFGLQKNQVVGAAELVSNSRYLNFTGLHSHIGSQILEADPFIAEVDILFELALEIKNSLNLETKELNLGGGWGVSYTNEKPLPIPQFLEKVIERVKEKLTEGENLKIIFEPGRSIVACAGITLYTISHVKDIPGIRRYAVIDGGMADNPRPLLYEAKYDALLANKAKAAVAAPVRVAGRFCESGDILINEINLPAIDPDDILAVLCTGAYNYSMASNYNRVGRPAMVLVNNGRAALISKRETYEDIIAGDVVA